MSEPFLGEINLFAGNFAPRNWAFCDGQLLPISSFTALFSLLGTIYGGDGRTTFALPDLRGRAIVGAGRGPGLSNYVQGQAGGDEDVTLSAGQMPAHTHGVSTSGGGLGAQSGNATQHAPGGGALAGATVQGNPGLSVYSSQPPDTDIEGAQVSGNLTLDNAGGSQAHTNMQPFLSLNYIIAIAGVFPSRN